MSRHFKQIDDHISIAYGYDHPLQGYFLQVYDDRLEWKGTNTEEENVKAEETDDSGCGEIDSYATNHTLTSKNIVSRSIFLEKLLEFNVLKEHTDGVALDQPI